MTTYSNPEYDSTYAPAAIRGPRLLRDCGSSSQSRLCSLWHRWFGTYWSPRGTRGRRSSETRSWLGLSLTAWWGLLWRSRVGLVNGTTGRPAFWSGGLRLGCFTRVTMKKKNLIFIVLLYWKHQKDSCIFSSKVSGISRRKKLTCCIAVRSVRAGRLEQTKKTK